MAAITVSNLGKAYKQYPHRWSRLLEWLLPGSKPRHQLKWVLQDVSFTVQPGEAVGIVGMNGAGKSTLLKIITGTVKPTIGCVQVHGRVAALLELGMGFHPDFTGRQNVIMAGQLLGLALEEIMALMSEIEAFADIGDYIDQPVRVYSSGMHVRLAFAISTATRPNVLIIDEALSVGDAAFQRKCFQRIESYQASGTTLLFVSHDIETVKRICSRAVLIDRGQVEIFGNAKEVCDAYERKLFGKGCKGEGTEKEINSRAFLDSALSSAQIERQYGEGSAHIHEITLRNDAGQLVNVIEEGLPFFVDYLVTFRKPARGVKFGMMIKSVDGMCVYGTNTAGLPYQQMFHSNDTVRVSFSLKGNLVPGTYYLNVGATRDGVESAEFMHRRIDSAIFRIVHAHSHVAMGFANMFAVSSVSSINVTFDK
jgi:lipopolysaccharide transport system ATP-binding protein